jgi:hypothetical protein
MIMPEAQRHFTIANSSLGLPAAVIQTVKTQVAV